MMKYLGGTRGSVLCSSSMSILITWRTARRGERARLYGLYVLKKITQGRGTGQEVHIQHDDWRLSTHTRLLHRIEGECGPCQGDSGFATIQPVPRVINAVKEARRYGGAMAMCNFAV